MEFYVTSPVLAVLFALFIQKLNAQLGFVCQGLVEFKAQVISTFEQDELYFYSDNEAVDLIDCARKCYRKEFCRAAVYTTRTRRCQHSYFKGACLSSTKRVSSFSRRGILQLTCIRCERGHRVEEAPVRRPRPFFSFRETQRVISSRRPSTFTRRRVSVGRSTVRRLNSRGDLPSTDGNFEKWTRKCYSNIEQKVLLGGGFAIERGLSLVECQCLCARSFLSRKYNLQCKSIMHYSGRHECVLSHQDKSNSSHPLVRLADNSSVTYHDFFCHRTEREITRYIENVCNYVNQPGPTTTSPSPESKQSDMCYREVKEHLMRGSAVAIQRKIPLKECKCICATSHQSGVKRAFRCMSIMYYYNEDFCIMNSDNRLQRPDKFHKDVTDYTVTYYGFSCYNSLRKVNEYVEEHCQNITDEESHFLEFGRKQ